jgi:hypothetical protein
MNYIGNESYFEVIRRNLLPPHPVSRLVDYDYCALDGRGLQDIACFESEPIVRLTLFATPSLDVPVVLDIKHSHPWEETDEEMADVLRRMVSLKLKSPDTRSCTDAVVECEHVRMRDHKLAFAMLAGWAADSEAGDAPSAVTLTYNSLIGARRSLAAFNAVLQDMVVGETDRMFSKVTSNLDMNVGFAKFPSSAYKLGNLSVPMY